MVEKKNLADLLAEAAEKMGISNPPVAVAYQNIIDRLKNGDAGRGSPKIGDSLPPFQLPDHRGRLVDSDDLLARGPLVVSMNRGQWCSFCRIELVALQENLADVKALGAGIVAISPEIRPYTNRLRERCGLTFPVLCDVDSAYALSLGLAIWLGDEVKPLFIKGNVDLSVSYGNSAWIAPIPATYVVDTDGRIVERFVDADFRKRMEPSDMISTLKAL